MILLLRAPSVEIMARENVISMINDMLSQIEAKIAEKRRPETLIEALRYEAENRYIFHALRIARGKLINDLRGEDVECLRGLAKYFEMAEKGSERVDDGGDREFMKRFYG